MGLKYQTLKNLCEKITAGRLSISTEAVTLIGECIEGDTRELIEEAIDLVKISKKKRIAAVHIMKARQTIKERR